MIGIKDSNEKIIGNGLVLELDAAQLRSYSGSGSTWSDISGNSNNATLVNSPSFSTNNGGYLTTNASSSYMSIANNSTLNSNTTTISLWFQYTSVGSGSGYASIISKHTTAGSYSGWNIYVFNNRIYGQIKNTTSQTDLTGSIISTNTWYNVVLVSVSGSTSRLYLNNSQVASATTLTYTVTTEPLRIASSIDTFFSYFGGNIANVLQYNRALSATEVGNNYNAVKSRFGL